MLLETLSATDKWGFTPLHEAAQKGRTQLCALLLAHGADPTLKNQEGQTPLDLTSADDVKCLLQDAMTSTVSLPTTTKQHTLAPSASAVAAVQSGGGSIALTQTGGAHLQQSTPRPSMPLPLPAAADAAMQPSKAAGSGVCQPSQAVVPLASASNLDNVVMPSGTMVTVLPPSTMTTLPPTATTTAPASAVAATAAMSANMASSAAAAAAPGSAVVALNQAGAGVGFPMPHPGDGSMDFSKTEMVTPETSLNMSISAFLARQVISLHKLSVVSFH